VVAGQGLDRCIPDAATLTVKVAAWRSRRNTLNDKADGRFTTADALVRLKSLHPALQGEQDTTDTAD
jgi:hypothetical protein